MAVSDGDILGWLNVNRDADDTKIATTMREAGVTPERMAQVTGLNYGDVARRYETALASSSGGGSTASTPTYSSTDETGAPIYDYPDTSTRNTRTERAFTGDTSGDDVLDTLASTIGKTSYASTDAQSAPSYDYFAQQFAPDGYTSSAASTVSTPASIDALYQQVLGRPPESQAVIDEWKRQFGDTIEPTEVEQFKQSAQLELTNPVLANLKGQILGQNLTAKWTGEGFGSAEANATDMAKIMTDIGITDINQFGKITKEVPTYSYDENGNQTQTGTQTVTTYGNKVTGQEVPNTYSERQTGNAFGGTFTGEGNTGYRVQFDDKGNPFFYTTGASSSDIADWGPILALASVIPSPLQPFAIAANAAVSIDQGDVLGGIAALAGLAGFSDVAAGARIAKAVDSGEPFAIVTSIMNSPFAGNIGGTMLTDTISLKDAGNALSVANNVANENWAGALTSANQLVNSPDLNTAAAAARFIKAFETNNFAGMYTAANGFTNAINAANKVTDKNVALNIANTVAADNSAATEGTQLAGLGTDTAASAGTSGDVTLPSGVQLASAGDGVFRTDVGGVPTYAESSNAATVKAPLGYTLLSMSESDEKPAGSYYDITANAWFKPDEAITNLTGSSNLQSDIDLFTSSQGDLDQIAASTPSTSDDSTADFLASIGITNTTQLADSGLSNQDILDMVNASSTTGGTGDTKTNGDNVPELVVTDKKDGTAVKDDVPEIVVTDKKEDVPEIVITDKKEDVPEIVVTDKKDDVPEIVVTDKKECDDGFHDDGTGLCVADDDEEPKECPEGYLRNLETGECEKIEKECPPGYTRKDGKCVKDTVVIPPKVTPPKTCPAGYVLVGNTCVPIPVAQTAAPTTAEGERTDPIYAGGMDDFNLFATLEELLSDMSDEKGKKKDNKKSKDKTKMATGGHLDDLLAEQMTVDDLLKLLR
jgi:hypothetical protein